MDLMALGIGDESIVYIVLQLTISFEHYYNLYLQIININYLMIRSRQLP